jgi:predicted nucleic acid-binding protein
MKYLLDTNIILEMQKSHCNPKVKDFIEQIPVENMYICAIVLGELSYGVEKLPPGKKKHDLSIWLYTKLPEWFRGRIIDLDTDTMVEWGRIRATAGRTLPVIDSLIASAAITRHMTLVTRNTRDFESIEGIMMINPFV